MQVAEAREEVWQRYKVDTLGLRRGKMFSLHTDTPHGKFDRGWSHQTLWRELSPARLQQNDARKLKTLYRYTGPPTAWYDRVRLY
jgi:hypothetical protein